MDWSRLLCTERSAARRDDAAAPRTPFQRDHDRVLYSSAFRRLGDKRRCFRCRSTTTSTRVSPTASRWRRSPLARHARRPRHRARRRAAAGARRARRGGLRRRGVPGATTSAILRSATWQDAFREFYAGWFARHAGSPSYGRSARRARRPAGVRGHAQSLRIVTPAGAAAAPGHGLDLTCATLGALSSTRAPSTGSRQAGGGSARTRHPPGRAAPRSATSRRASGCPPRRTGPAAWRRHPLRPDRGGGRHGLLPHIDSRRLRLGAFERERSSTCCGRFCEASRACRRRWRRGASARRCLDRR